jgi:hypothetical protein
MTAGGIGRNPPLVARLGERFGVRHGHSASSSEIASWERSLPVLAHDLIDAGLGDVEGVVEYRLPQNSKRADVVLCGNASDVWGGLVRRRGDVQIGDWHRPWNGAGLRVSVERSDPRARPRPQGEQGS